jgi:hypothetical protein
MDVEATFFKKKLKNILDDSSVLFRNIKTERSIGRKTFSADEINIFFT